MDNWRFIELDLQDKGIDVESGILGVRSWRWLELRIADLVFTGQRLPKALGRSQT